MVTKETTARSDVSGKTCCATKEAEERNSSEVLQMRDIVFARMQAKVDAEV